MSSAFEPADSVKWTPSPVWAGIGDSVEGLSGTKVEEGGLHLPHPCSSSPLFFSCLTARARALQ